MALSIHDNRLISYEVHCKARTIQLRTEYRVKGDEPAEFTDVTFRDVQGYQFENDAFGNILLGLDAIPLDQFLAEYGERISEAYETAGAPGPWAADLATAQKYLRERGIQGFVLSSSYGLSGWVLARDVSISAVAKGASNPPPRIPSATESV